MLKKIQHWLQTRKLKKAIRTSGYSREELERAYRIGYNDGRRDGLAIAREQATNSLKEILWQTNKTTKPSKTPENRG